MATTTIIENIASIRWMGNHGEIDSSWRVFATRAEARAALAVPGSAMGVGDRDGAIPLMRALYEASRHSSLRARCREAGEAGADMVPILPGSTSDWHGGDAYYGVNDATASAGRAAEAEFLGPRLAPEHRETARRHLAVWEAGYGLYAEVDGVLYVYRAFE